jgi:RND family efflux transporter MFP subunit
MIWCTKQLSRLGYLLAVTVAVVVTAGCSRGEAAASSDAETTGQANVRVTNVETTPVMLGEFRGFIRVTGEVEALYDVTISAEETGRIERFLVEKGRRVRSGQAIARLENDLLSAQVDEARASAQLAREEYERQRQLWEEDSIGTEMAFLQRRYASEMATARLSSLEARLQRTEIVAPVTGTFEENFLEVGEMALPGAAVVRLVATDRVKIVAGVPERHARTVVVGDEARVTLDVFPDQEFVGEVSFAGATVDPRSRTFRVEVILDNPESMMKPAMVANLQVEREHLDNVISVPQQVVLRSAEGYKVFVAESEGEGYVAYARTVELGAVSGDDVVIQAGLELGELLITVGYQLVDDGSPIRIVNGGQSGQAEEEN